MKTRTRQRPRPSSLLGRLWADPDVRLVIGLAGVALTALPIETHQVGPREVRAFRTVNDLPDGLFVPAWPVMQLGTVGAGPAVAVLAHLAGNDRLARRVLVTGPVTWALSKAVKRAVRRGRPGSLLSGVHTRGQEASGLGFVSGHAGVAVAIGVALLRGGRLRRARLVALALMPVVGLTRIYVGAHLPLDVVGGAALGLAVDAGVDVVERIAAG